MENQLNVLVVNLNDRGGTVAETISGVYGQEFSFGSVEFTTTLHRAIQSIREESYQVCFISSFFEVDEVKSFFFDLSQIEPPVACVCIQFVQKIEGELDREAPKEFGFKGVVSLQGTHTDREQLHIAFEEFTREAEIIRRKIDVDGALNLVLRRIDDAARDKKRDIIRKIDHIPAEFIELQTDFDDAILTGYFEALEKKTGHAEPENNSKLAVPTAILKKNLPNLQSDRYTGVSTRVWKKMLRKHGIEEDSVSVATATEEPQEAPSDTELESE